MCYETKKNDVSKTKTILCNSLITGENECTFLNCKYAHSVDELQLRECDFGFNCNNFDCVYFHSDIENFDLWLKRLNYQNLKNIKVNCITKEKHNPQYTKLCKSVIKGFKRCLIANCKYAHSVKQLQIMKCIFDKNCRSKSTCNFKHSEETIKDYLIKKGYYKYRQISVEPTVLFKKEYSIHTKSHLQSYENSIKKI